MSNPNKVQNYGKISGPMWQNDKRHGTPSGYFYWKCRCNKCRDAASDYSREYREKRLKELVHADHGKTNTYRIGCRCSLCVEATRQAREGKRNYYQSKRDRVKLGDLA